VYVCVGEIEREWMCDLIGKDCMLLRERKTLNYRKRELANEKVQKEEINKKMQAERKEKSLGDRK